MFTVINRTRVLIAALALSAFAPPASANAADPMPVGTARNRTAGRVEATKATETGEERPRAGSPEFGVLIILGAVAFIVVVAWLISRIGDDSGPRDDRSLL
jgi:hypothetical protein